VDHLSRDELIQWRDRGNAADRERITSHLATCASCAAAYAELIRTAPATQMPIRFNPEEFVARGYAVRRDPPQNAWPAFVTSWKVWASAFSAAMAVLLVVLVAPRFDSGVTPGERPFTTLSGPPGATSGVRLTIMFQPSVTEEAMRQALLDIEGNVVSGPSALGVYIVQIPATPDDDRAIQALIDKLRSHANVVRFVEREP
jgi:anti-sigma factor RsiW